MSSVLNKVPIKEIVSSPEVVKRITLSDVIKSNNMPKLTRDASDIIESISKPAVEVKEQAPKILERERSVEFERIPELNVPGPAPGPVPGAAPGATSRLRSLDIETIPKPIIGGAQGIPGQGTGQGQGQGIAAQGERRPGIVRDQSSIFDYNRELPRPLASGLQPALQDQGELPNLQGLLGGEKGIQEEQETKRSFSNMLNKIKKDIESRESTTDVSQGQINLPRTTSIFPRQSIMDISQGQILLPRTTPGYAGAQCAPCPLSCPETSTTNVFNIQLTCNAPTAYDFVQMEKNAKTLVGEKTFLEKFTDDQLNRIGLDRNIPDVVIYPKDRKIQMILSDPNRIEYNNMNTPLNDMTIGDLLYVAGRENIPVHHLPDRYNVRRILVALILYQRKRSDLIQHNLLTDDDLRTIVNVIQAGNEVEYSWILRRCDLEKVIDTGNFPTYTNEFMPRWRRYEILKILPQPFLQSVSFQLSSSDLAMVPTDNYIIARLIDLPENPFEAIYAKHRNVDREFLKVKYGLLVPRIWDSMDYIGLNGPFYPLTIPDDPFTVEKLLTIISSRGRMEYLNRYHDIVLLQEIKNYVPYNGRLDLIENILKIFDSSEDIYFACLVPQLQGKIYYGNYTRSEVYSPDTLAAKLDFLTTQNYPLEDKLEITKKTRQLITVLLNMNMMTPKLAASISRLITTYEENPDAQPYFYYFLLMDAKEIATIRKLFYQRFYYAQTRNCLYANKVESNFVNKLPKLYNINRMIPREVVEKSNDDLYDTIAYMKLFFGYIPHSIRNLGMS